MNIELKQIIDARDIFNETKAVGDYVITGHQQGSQPLINHTGYIVQVRGKAGDYGSDLVLIRHPDGRLMQHANQSYYKVSPQWLDNVIALFPEGMTPDGYEDYSEAYTLAGGSFPEVGKVIRPKGHHPIGNEVITTVTESKTGGVSKITVF